MVGVELVADDGLKDHVDEEVRGKVGKPNSFEELPLPEAGGGDALVEFEPLLPLLA